MWLFTWWLKAIPVVFQGQTMQSLRHFFSEIKFSA